MKTNNKNSKGHSKPIPNNLDSGMPIQNRIWKRMRRWKSQFIVSGVVVIFAILSLLDEVLDPPHLLGGASPTPINWAEIALDMVAIFLVGSISVFMLGVVGPKRKPAEEALRESEDRYRDLVERAGITILIDDEEGHFKYFNERFAELFGYSFKETGKQSIKSLVHPEDIDRVMRYHRERLQGKKVPSRYEFRGVKKDSSTVYLEVDVVELKKGESIIGTRSYIWDITERKQAEEELRQYREHLEELVAERTSELRNINEQLEQDITERKRAEKTLRESEQRYRLLFEQNLAAVYRTTFDGTVLDCNESFAWLFGYESREEVLTHRASEFYFDATDRQAFIARLQEQSFLTNFEMCMRRKDGKPVWILENVSLIEGDENTATVIQGTSIDITERKRAEEVLGESEEKFRVFAEQNLLGVVIIQDGYVKYVNEAASEITEYSIEEALDWKENEFVKLFHPDDREFVIEQARKKQKGDEDVVPHYSYRIITKSRKVRWVDQYSKTIVFEEKTADFITLIDITERKRAEEALEQKIAELNTFINNIPDMAWLKDADSRFIAANRAFGEAAGMDPESLINQSCEVCFGKEAAKKFREDDLTIMKGGKQVVIEEKIIDSQGNEVFLETIKSPIFSESGKAIGTVGIARNITERKRAEEALRESEERFRIASQIASDVVYERDGQTGIATFYGDIDSHLGYEPGGYPRTMEGWRKHVHPEDLAWINNKSIDQLEPGVPYTIEYRMKKKDETYMTWSDRIMIIRDEKTGKPLKFIGAATDITERKRAEEALEKERERLFSVLDIMPAFVYLQAPDYSVPFANRKFRELFGDAGDRPCYEAFYGREKPCDPCITLRVLQTRAPQTWEWTSKDGRHYMIYDDLLPGTDGEDMVLEIGVDITEHKRAEEALERQRDIAVTCSGARDLTEAVNRLFDNLLEIEEFDCAGFYLLDRDTGALDMIAYRGLPDRFVEKVSHLDADSPYTKLVMEGKPIVQKTGDFPPAIREDLQSDGVLCVAAIPIQHEGKIIGDLNMASHTCDGFSASARYVLESVSAQIGETIVRARMEDALRKSEEKYRNLVEKMPDVIYSLDKEGNIASVNKAVKTVLGLEPEEIIGRNFAEFAAKEMLSQAMKQFKQILAGKEITTETIMIDKDGKLHNVEFNSAPITKDGKVVGSQGIVRDITERKQVEEALRESEQFNLSLLNNSPNPILVINPDTSVRYVNPALRKLTGLSSAEIIGKKAPYLWWTEETLKKTSKDLEQAMSKGAQKLEELFQRKDGERFWVEITSTPVRSNGEFKYYLANWVDITERKQAEETLQSERDRLQALMEGLARTGIGIDIVGIDYKVLFQNLTLREKFGDLTGKLCYENYMGLKEPCEFCPMLKAIKNNRVESVELKASDGRNYELISAPFPNPDGTIEKVVEIVMDITEKKKMEAQLIQAERLSAVGTLAYGIAHEFNNILAGILGNAEFGMGNDDPQQINECFRIIMESCDRATGITNSLLAFSRQREAKKQRADITDTVETVLGLTERELEKQDINVVRKFNPIPEITCDLGELSGVVLNMITNARDAMQPKGGTLTIEIGKKEENIEMIFTDTGCGIPDNIKSRLFEPFVTTKGALGQSEVPGTGLGLFLSYGIVTRYQGRIDVISEKDKGSKFTIRIPISKNQESPVLVEPEEEKTPAVPQNLNILLVDDEEPICTAVKKFFENKGHSVTTALSGKKGLKIFKKGSFDLVLADITMPDMDGVELIYKLKKIDQQMKFIVLTGHIAEDKLESAKRAGADEILMKPFRNEDLYQAVGKVLTI